MFRICLLMALGRSWCSFREAVSGRKYQEEKRRLKARLNTIARIVREDGELVLWEVEQEQYWLPRGSRILPGMLAEQKLGVYERAGHGVRAGDVVLDCGASIGLYALHALSLGAARVVAVEPSPRNIECLQRNLADAIRDGRATIVPKGVWDQNEMRTLRMQPENSAGDSVALDYRGSESGPQVPVTTIDSFVRELSLERLDYIKMDIEGAERATLRGAAETIRRFRPRMTIDPEHRFDDTREIPKIVAAIRDDYEVSRGPCIYSGHALRPVILTFY